MEPFLRIELNHQYILFSNNERGFLPQDVLAICSLAVSTKSSEKQQIGDKGVGFKSVFSASDNPILVSRAWKFCFRASQIDAMSYITPIWMEDDKIPAPIVQQGSTQSTHTHLYLPLKFIPRSPEANQFLDNLAKAMDPCILLNMKRLTRLDIIDQRDNKMITISKQVSNPLSSCTESPIVFEGMTFIDLKGVDIQLKTTSDSRKFRVYSCFIDAPLTAEHKQDKKMPLTLAFPLDNDDDLNANVYTGLPVRDLGFRFIMDAKFKLVTNRENVRENDPFNTSIRDHLAVLFVYLMLNDTILKRNISKFCPSKENIQLRHSSWWLCMVDRIDELVMKHLTTIFGIHSGSTSSNVTVAVRYSLLFF